MQEVSGVHYVSRFADRWGFFLGTGRDLQRIDNPGKWEDILFSFARDRVTGSVREDMSYTLQFRGDGGEILRRRITGVRTTDDLVLEVRYWHPLEAQWEVYWHAVIDDSSIVQHAGYVEAKTKPVGVAEDLISKADEEYTVTLTGKRIEVPRVWPAGPITVVNKPGTYGKAYSVTRTEQYVENYYIVKYAGPTDQDQTGKVTYAASMNGSLLSANPYWGQSVCNPMDLIIAKSGHYRITNNSEYRVELWASSDSPSAPLELISGMEFLNWGDAPNPVNLSKDGVINGASAWVRVNGSKLNQGGTFDGVLAKGDVITLGVGDVPVKPDAASSTFAIVAKPSSIHDYNVEVRIYFTGTVTIEPIQDIEAVPPLTAPAVRDIDLFAQLCRQVTGGKPVDFDFSGYKPAYMDNPDGSRGAAFLLCLSRLKESPVTDGVATPQGSDEAYFKGLTLNMFYKYFLAQGYKVGVETRRRGDTVRPTVFVAPYCNTNRPSYFYPAYNAATSPVVADLGTAVTDIELSRYQHAFLQVVAGREPEDFGAFPREEGYQDPCNRRITYGIGIDNPGEAYTLEVPFPLTTLGLEEELQNFEGESDEARQQRWTEGEGIHLVCGTADAEGRIASITQYPAVPGLFYRPLNMGFRPESLMRRNLPLLGMSLAPFDMDGTMYTVEEIEGDDIDVTSDGAQTGDASLPRYTTHARVDGTADEQLGIFRPVMITFRSGSDQNIYASLTDNATRYGVVKFRYRGQDVVGYLRGVDLNPTERSVQKWEILPVWPQRLDFLDN